ncbi:DUF742 domain-containing protein [Streptomyces sp. RKAG290]|uniref:DUF742 domain-containing protein n=1 Tax=Streptomyces sp. RKAG290 TaxID=2888348 RepID=UPI002034133A|nr:DUF742 domain-containing protein [Streptomyces sp. RKAG290]MCM2413312.1 DUF742 domain-containing protein [Streptomyces sp. RKAG290]
MTASRHGRRLVPAYLATTGCAQPTRNTLDRLTVLSAAGSRVPEGLVPAQRRLAVLIHGGALPLAEAAAYLHLPVSVLRVLVADLVDAGHLVARAPIPEAQRPEPQLLERVLSGLRSIREPKIPGER